jgi:drug/metabolite transporter (DMT)-like permease
MTSTAILLILFSVFVHVGWNLVGKQAHPATALFLGSVVMDFLFKIPILIWAWRFYADLPAQVWIAVVFTGACQAIYFIGLAGAYRTGDLSVAYPLARSIAPMVVVLAAIPLGRAEQISVWCTMGIVLILSGGFLLPMKRLGELRLGNYLNACCMCAFVAAVGTAGYSLLDDFALRVMREQAAPSFGVWSAVLVYVPLQAMSTLFWLGSYVLLNPRERVEIPAVIRTRKTAVILTGIGFFVGYFPVLTALAYVSEVSYAVAFRQLSIPLGALLGVVFLREPGYPTKFAGAGLIFMGGMMVALG